MEEIYRLSSFPKEVNGGNLAGVVLNADLLSDEDMLAIAKKIGYSETAFILKSNIADFKLRFFTPKVEVDLCGHATIAAFSLLKQKEIIHKGSYHQETKAGILRIDIENNIIFMEQKNPEFSENISFKEVKKCFKNNIFKNHNLPITIVSTGIKEIFFPVNSVNDLNELNPNFELIKELSIKYNCIGIHAFALDDEVDAYGRNFAPLVGIDEESATGTSNGALACYLYNNLDINKDVYILRQGYSMNKPSEIIVKLKIKDSKIDQVSVGGTAILLS